MLHGSSDSKDSKADFKAPVAIPFYPADGKGFVRLAEVARQAENERIRQAEVARLLELSN